LLLLSVLLLPFFDRHGLDAGDLDLVLRRLLLIVVVVVGRVDDVRTSALAALPGLQRPGLITVDIWHGSVDASIQLVCIVTVVVFVCCRCVHVLSWSD